MPLLPASTPAVRSSHRSSWRGLFKSLNQVRIFSLPHFQQRSPPCLGHFPSPHSLAPSVLPPFHLLLWMQERVGKICLSAMLPSKTLLPCSSWGCGEWLPAPREHQKGDCRWRENPPAASVAAIPTEPDYMQPSWNRAAAALELPLYPPFLSARNSTSGEKESVCLGGQQGRCRWQGKGWQDQGKGVDFFPPSGT